MAKKSSLTNVQRSRIVVLHQEGYSERQISMFLLNYFKGCENRLKFMLQVLTNNTGEVFSQLKELGIEYSCNHGGEDKKLHCLKGEIATALSKSLIRLKKR